MFDYRIEKKNSTHIGIIKFLGVDFTCFLIYTYTPPATDPKIHCRGQE